jgi:epoxyqueuosine reductase
LNIEERIKQKAIEIGFCKVGIAEALPLEEEYKYFQQWIQSGFHAEMKYLAKNYDKRFDVRNFLPNAQSVIVCADNYFTSIEHPKSKTGDKSGKISRYAWAADYHDVIIQKLNLIVDFLNGIDDTAQSKGSVDSSPIAEKQWARSAGIGWQGKNGLIITKEFGSWIFLGVIVTTLKLNPDKPVRNYCGTCKKCIDACPTGAIIKPSVIDAKKCISYCTIEMKPDMMIPSEVAKNADSWIYGCDICQQVCPWNTKAKPTNEKAYQTSIENTFLTLEQIENMTKEDFNVHFEHNPIKRLKLEGLKRNARDIL